MKHRREIDGLRAVAVLPVILFHAGFGVFSGGYVGVDVFFVISGYLITNILVTELEQGDFSIARFYERRARRILPALFAVMLACLPFAYLWMLPSQLTDFAESLIAVIFFASNVLFWDEDGYFAPAAEFKPLLHTWSLAVEEQYYLVFPIFLLVLWRLGRQRVFWSVVALAVLSLLLSEWGWRNKPSANFYLAPTRAWELLAGSICAFMTVDRAQRSSNLLSAAGLAMIVFAIFAYTDRTPFPSLYTLLPVVGTSLVILFAAQDTWITRLLSLPGFVGIGLISYSAYLWHQPLFAFARLRSLTEPSHLVMAALGVASLLLAWVTWHYVEQPFRKHANHLIVKRRSVFAVSGAIGAMFVALGLTVHVGRGFEWRFSTDILRYADAESDRASLLCHLFPSASLPSLPVRECLFANEQGGVNVLLTGDSHAVAISEVLGDQLRRLDIGFFDLSYSSCPPLPGLRRFDGRNTPNYMCDEFIRSTVEYAERENIDVIVLTGRFPLYLRGDRFDNGEGGIETGPAAWVDLQELTDSSLNDMERRVRVLAAYEQRIRELADRFNVVLVYPVPEAGWNVPLYSFRNAYFNDGDGTLTTSYAVYRERTQEVNRLFDQLVAEVRNVHGARIHEVLCSGTTGRCVNADVEGVYYYDDDHLSNAGALLVAPVIIDAIEEALQAANTAQTE